MAPPTPLFADAAGKSLVQPLICVGPMVGGMQVVLQSDNAGLVFMLLKEHSRDTRLCALLQAIVAVQSQIRAGSQMCGNARGSVPTGWLGHSTADIKYLDGCHSTWIR